MNQQKTKPTVSEWDALEVEKLATLQTLTAKIEALNIRRGGMLLLIAEGEGKAGNKEIEAIDKEQKDITLEIESLHVLLAAIPKRRDLARADEIESTINTIEVLDQRLAELSVKIDMAAESFVMATREYYDTLKAMEQINHYAFDFMNLDHGMINSIGVFLRKCDLWKFIKVGVYRNPTLMTEKNLARRTISPVLERMRNHAKQLRGVGELPSNICKKCYGGLNIDFSDNKRHCSKCGAVEGK